MKHILSVLVIGGVFISCSKEEAEPAPWNLATTMKG